MISVVRDEELVLLRCAPDQPGQWIDDKKSQSLSDAADAALIARSRVLPHDLLPGREHDDANRELVGIGDGPQIPELVLDSFPGPVERFRLFALQQIKLHRESRAPPLAS